MKHSFVSSSNLKKRECGECTACCEGWLSGEAYGHEFFPGQPCFYVCKTGCSIYENRPEDPCRGYTCVWLEEEEIFPYWMKPSESNVICCVRTWTDINGNDHDYFGFTTTGKEITAKVYHWIMKFHFNTKIPITVSFHDDLGIYGPDEFIDFISKQ